MGLDMYLYEKQTHEIAYWRKANAIHGWIINRTNAIDDCTPINLYKQDIIDLRDTCIKVIEANTQDAAEEFLPPMAGFFFGGGVDDWYWENVKETVERLTTIIDQSVDDATFEYRASW